MAEGKIKIREVKEDVFLSLQGAGPGVFEKIKLACNVASSREELKLLVEVICSKMPGEVKQKFDYGPDKFVTPAMTAYAQERMADKRNEKKDELSKTDMRSESAKLADSVVVSEDETGSFGGKRGGWRQNFAPPKSISFSEGDDFTAFQSLFEDWMTEALKQANRHVYESEKLLALRCSLQGKPREQLEKALQNKLIVEKVNEAMAFLKKRFHRVVEPEIAMRELSHMQQRPDETAWQWHDRVAVKVREAYPDFAEQANEGGDMSKVLDSFVTQHVVRGLANQEAAETIYLYGFSKNLEKVMEIIRRYEVKMERQNGWPTAAGNKQVGYSEPQENAVKVNQFSVGNSGESQVMHEVKKLAESVSSMASKLDNVCQEVAQMKWNETQPPRGGWTSASKWGGQATTAPRPGGGGGPRPGGKFACYLCNDPGHFMRNCPRWRSATPSQMQQTRSEAEQVGGKPEMAKIRAVLCEEEGEWKEVWDHTWEEELVRAGFHMGSV